MQNNQSDRFEQTKHSFFEKEKSSAQYVEDNFFMAESSQNKISYFVNEQSRRLNDYDFNLLQEDAYKDIQDDLFKLEYKISKIEDEIKYLDGQIQAARDINDYDLIKELDSRKQQLTMDLQTLLVVYKEKSISAKISGGISNIFTGKLKHKFQFVKNFQKVMSDFFLSIMPSKLASALELKRSLSRLENINRSVDELMTMNSPYGENAERYEQLSKYIIRANAIQSQISQHMK